MKKFHQWLFAKNNIASRLAETRITNFSVVLAALGIIIGVRAFYLDNAIGYDGNGFWPAALLVLAFLDFMPLVWELYDDKD
ncbi:MAG: hypothetical protein Q4D23_11945 [Bacteroidales bacterium]|nr:hypothetical protein [Bacteroidales bacterium]